MNKKYKFILMLLIVLFAISSYFFIKEIAENKKENNIYEDLQEIVKNEENSIQENDYTNASEDKSDNISTENNTNPDDFYNLENISKINTDVIGWIKINGTNINYLELMMKTIVFILYDILVQHYYIEMVLILELFKNY